MNFIIISFINLFIFSLIKKAEPISENSSASANLTSQTSTIEKSLTVTTPIIITNTISTETSSKLVTTIIVSTNTKTGSSSNKIAEISNTTTSTTTTSQNLINKTTSANTQTQISITNGSISFTSPETFSNLTNLTNQSHNKPNTQSYITHGVAFAGFILIIVFTSTAFCLKSRKITREPSNFTLNTENNHSTHVSSNS